jgi:hypothetical protein
MTRPTNAPQEGRRALTSRDVRYARALRRAHDARGGARPVARGWNMFDLGATRTLATTKTKPSDGLEPSIPSLPWRFWGVTRVHARSLATHFLLQIGLLQAVEMRREASRMSFLMCPFCVRAPSSVWATSRASWFVNGARSSALAARSGSQRLGISAHIACTVGRTRISLSVTRCGRLTAKAMTSAMSCGGIDQSRASLETRLLSAWVMWSGSSVAVAPGSMTMTGRQVAARRAGPPTSR